ncbi:MAG: formimidoyltetrahydrofolate cyclodeaminase [Phycisphaerales bacterium]|nr:formimidoyltetrahydrofolate cyclodeaminase [Phycisphaerales bacterium]
MPDATATINDFLDATAAKHPTPGGGAVTALAGALAAAMGEMVLNYSVGRKNQPPAADAELRPALDALHAARVELLALMADDQVAYGALTAARKLPDDVPGKAEQVAASLAASIRGPQRMGDAAVALLEACDRVVDLVNPYLLSDLAVCADLAMATVRCAAHNVRVNLPDVGDPAERQRLGDETERTSARGLALVRQVAPRIWARVERAGG